MPSAWHPTASARLGPRPSRPSVRIPIVVLGAVVALSATIWLDTHANGITLSAGLLLMLLVVVVVAALSNVAVAIIVAVSAVLLANWFLVPPTHTLVIGSTENVILLAVFVIAAVLSSLTVTAALRRTAQANLARTEAAVLRDTLAQPAGEADPIAILRTMAGSHMLDEVRLLDSEGRVAAAWASTDGTGQPRLDLTLADGYRVQGWGPAVIGEDRQTFEEMALAAARSHQARQLRARASRAQEIEDADRARSALLAAVGHDLRTPLAAITLAAGTLRQTQDQVSEADREVLVDTIADSARRLDTLIANLLDMSRLEAGKLLVTLAPTAVDAVVAEAVMTSGIGDINLELEAELPMVTADQGLLQRVLANLLSNAQRHGGGVVCCSAHRVGDQVEIAVVDRGPGLPSTEDPPSLPPMAATGTGDGGLGMGLAIAQGFCDAMGAQLRPEPTPGGGLTMVVSLAVAP